MNRRAFLASAACLSARGEDWPQFRGPGGQGHSLETGLPVEWSESRNIAWKTPVPGRGWSSPSVAGNRIWVTTATNGGRSLRALAFDSKSGRMVTDVEVFGPTGDLAIHGKNSQSSPTPLIEGDHVYLHFGSHGTACIKTTGETLWKTRLVYDHRHGPGGSPALYKDLLILSCDGYDTQFVAALDKRTGETRWKKPRDGYQAYTTPLIISVNGKDQVVSPGAHHAISYDPLTGEEIWSIGYAPGYSNVPRPVYGHGLVFICTGFDQPSLVAVRPDGKGDGTKSHIAWTISRGAPLTPSPILVGDELYFVSDNGVATCVDARTGREHWRNRLGGNYSASPVYAGGHIYFTSEECTTSVIARGRQFRLVATSSLDARCLASLAVSDGAIFLRTDSHLYRIEKSAS